MSQSPITSHSPQPSNEEISEYDKVLVIALFWATYMVLSAIVAHITGGFSPDQVETTFSHLTKEIISSRMLIEYVLLFALLILVVLTRTHLSNVLFEIRRVLSRSQKSSQSIKQASEGRKTRYIKEEMVRLIYNLFAAVVGSMWFFAYYFLTSYQWYLLLQAAMMAAIGYLALLVAFPTLAKDFVLVRSDPPN